MEAFNNNFLEFFFILTGLLMAHTGVNVLLDPKHPTRLQTAVFWFLLAATFSIGRFIPPFVSGVMVVGMGILTLFNQVKIGPINQVSEEKAEERSKRLGNKIFIPVVSLASIAIIIAQFTPLGGQVGIGVAAVLSVLIAMFITKSDGKVALHEGDRMVRQVGTVGILPQLLAALGVIFTAAGVGDVIAGMISTVVPEGNQLIGVIAYVLGMVVFTMIMGNAFAAFTVITAGIGVPFVIAQGADPVIAGTLAMTAGYCGTLMTPMAANFNALPVALLEMKNPNGVIKEQLPYALLMIIVHIALMYFWAF
ncbi:DUF979 domain-containing protein [Alkalibacterium kapii]|uniref:Permease n=1 Tax=Alkalibacterium kapii TaxID=426704 RepID=A0A511ASX1_9LACT|nr:DUF979 domain-containing protein [Alkalibacterium kapii]GEK91295.1 permease [Alkalibacterium kapii]